MIEMHFKPEMLAAYGLPDVGYPGTVELLSDATEGRGQLEFAQMLHLFQMTSAEGDADWQASEPARARLAELVCPEDDRSVVCAESPDWWLEIGPVDLDCSLVTIQRGRTLVAAATGRKDGTLRIAAYRPLDAHSAGLLMNLGSRPDPRTGIVCMRPSNWEHACDCAGGTGQVYAFSRGEAHLSYWPSGLGRRQDRHIDPHWWDMRSLQPRRAAMVAVELGVAYAYSAEP